MNGWKLFALICGLVFGLLLVIGFWLLIGLVPYALTTYFPGQGRIWGPAPDPTAGIIGDMFGMVNAFFSALAFFGVIVTLLLQIYELRENRKEYEEMVTSQRKSALFSAMAARFESLRFTENAMTSIIEMEIPIDDFIIARNKLRVVSKTLANMLAVDDWNDDVDWKALNLQQEFVPCTSDDSAAQAAEHLIKIENVIMLAQTFPRKDDPQSIDRWLQLRRSSINACNELLEVFRTIKDDDYYEFIFLDEFIPSCDSAIFQMQNIIASFDSHLPDGIVRSNIVNSNFPQTPNGGLWTTTVSLMKQFLSIYRKNAIRWAKLASIAPSPATSPVAPSKPPHEL